jgi:glycosyltransferase involved in cell wall biosynthesis
VAGAGPKISVAVPASGRPRFLEECLLSVIRQTLPASEIVVSEDGQDAKNAIIVERYIAAGAPIRHITNVPPLGQFANRQQAFRLTTGDVVAMLDDDDAWNDDFLGETFGALEANGCSFCSSDHYIMNADSQILDDESNAASIRFGRAAMSEGRYDDVLHRELVSTSFPLQFTLFSRRDLEAIGFFPSYGKTVPDFALFLELGAARFAGYFLPKRLGRYRVHADQQTHNRIEQGLALTESLRAFCARHPGIHLHERDAAAELYRRSVIELAIAYAHDGQRRRSIEALRSYRSLGWGWVPPSRAFILGALLVGARKHRRRPKHDTRF